jgi:hypothetical protein
MKTTGYASMVNGLSKGPVDINGFRKDDRWRPLIYVKNIPLWLRFWITSDALMTSATNEF